MTKVTIDLTQAALQLANLVQEVGNGAEVVITCNGQPVARLVSPETTPPDRGPGSAKGLFVVPDDFDAPLEDFRDSM
jgi:prevent-host-death family protein